MQNNLIFNCWEYDRCSDGQFIMMLYQCVEKYLKFKKSCEIAKNLLIENCHDFYITINSENEDYVYNKIMEIANKRNIPVNLSIYDLNCSLEDVSAVLNVMCGLELSWLDEHRSIFDTSEDRVSSFFEEEEKTVRFYRGLISNLSKEQISTVEESIDDMFTLSL